MADKMDKDDLALLDEMCSTEDCPNYREEGYIICLNCLHGAATRAPEWKIERKKEILQRMRGHVKPDTRSDLQRWTDIIVKD
jgi:uncharacterized Zn finger protein (UPF0148 family)